MPSDTCSSTTTPMARTPRAASAPSAGKFKQNQVVFTLRMKVLPCVENRAYHLSFLEQGPGQRVVIPEVRLLYFLPQFAEPFFLVVYFKDNLLIRLFYWLFPAAGILDH